MNTEEILLTCLLVSIVVCMLLRPFVTGQSVRRFFRRKADRAWVPENWSVGIAVSERKYLSAHRFRRKNKGEAFLNR
ncbi:hypothetical protein [uncultured Rikenella sp.]|uniref:hypothetical protein n=1 Tax=uncultured Rikenella sp. TaxID=368003 RepID=UPI00261FF0C7|nr:hypothetical protein [uncultured Rikenella sp.]